MSGTAANCGMTPHYKATKRYQERHRRLGPCVSCSRKAKTGMLECRVCLARTRELWMARHPKFCRECGKLIKPEERHIGKKFHKLCAQRRMARMYPQQHRLAVLTYQRTHRKMGLCFSCPRKAFKGALCRKHYRMAAHREGSVHSRRVATKDQG